MSRKPGIAEGEAQAGEDVPADLREFADRLAAQGISVSLPTAPPGMPFPDPVPVRAPLSTAIIAERHA